LVYLPPPAPYSTLIEKRPGGIWIVEKEGKRIRVQAHLRSGYLTANIQGQAYFGTIVQPKRKKAGVAAGGLSEDAFLAQFPGKVKKLSVEPGSTVEENQVLLALEAMKMEFLVKAPVAGRVQKFLVKEGDTVSPGQKLLEFTQVKEDS
jgi:biotin carboxyl carrier protein